MAPIDLRKWIRTPTASVLARAVGIRSPEFRGRCYPSARRCAGLGPGRSLGACSIGHHQTCRPVLDGAGLRCPLLPWPSPRAANYEPIPLRIQTPCRMQTTQTDPNHGDAVVTVAVVIAITAPSHRTVLTTSAPQAQPANLPNLLASRSGWGF